jgi:hypothetical protein
MPCNIKKTKGKHYGALNFNQSEVINRHLGVTLNFNYD